MHPPENNLPIENSQPVNVASNSQDPTEVALSNLTAAPFVLDGRCYESVEAFWQGLKFPDQAKRDEVAKMSGRPSKKIGDTAMPSSSFEYNGIIHQVGSLEHQKLMDRALRAKIEQHPEILALLLATGTRPIIHAPKRKDGTAYPDSTSIPAEIFSGILMSLRAEHALKRSQG